MNRNREDNYTDIFEQEFEIYPPDSDGTTSIRRYYALLQPLYRKPVRVIGIGELKLPSRTWRHYITEYPSGIFKLSWWKDKVPAPGEGRVTEGRVIKNRIPPLHLGRTGRDFGYNSLVECELPPEAPEIVKAYQQY